MTCPMLPLWCNNVIISRYIRIKNVYHQFIMHVCCFTVAEMVRAYKRAAGSRKYGQYSSSNMDSQKIWSGALTLRKASIKYNISCGTLNNHKRSLYVGKPGRSAVFTSQEEPSLVRHIKTVSDWGFPFTTLDMRYIAHSFSD